MGALQSKTDDSDNEQEIDYGMSERELQDLYDDQRLVESEPIFRRKESGIGEETKVTELITANQIKTPYLKALFNQQSQEAIDLLLEVRQENEFEGNYEWDVILAFWCAIQQEDIKFAAYLMDYDPQLRYIATLAYHKKKECRYDKIPPKKHVDDFNKTLKNKLFGGITGGLTGGLAGGLGGKLLGGLGQLKNNNAADQTNDKEGGCDSRIETGGRVLVKNGKLYVQPDFDFDGGGEYFKSNQSSKYQMEGGANSDLDIEKSDMMGRGKQESSSSFLDEGEGEDDYGSYISSHSHSCDSDDGWPEQKSEEEDKESDLDVEDAGDDEEDVMISGMDDGNEDGLQIDVPRPLPLYQLYVNKFEREEEGVKKTHTYEFMAQHLRKHNMRGITIERLEIRTKWQIQKIKIGLQRNFPHLMAQILEILLYREEEDLACYLTAFYDFNLEKKKGTDVCKLIFLAIEYNQYKWLNYVWAFKRNYFNSDQKQKIDLIELFEIINTVCSQKRDLKNEVEREIKKVCQWFLDFEYDMKPPVDENNDGIIDEEEMNNEEQDNILQALLYHKQDTLCLDYMGHFACFLNKQLFLFSLKKNNKEFIRESLLKAAFDKQIFKEEEVVNQILEYFEVGSKTIFLLNTMILTDVSLWKNQPLSDLISMFSKFGEDTYESNSLLQSCNPLQCITLSCELLQIIGQSRKRFENECSDLMNDLLELGKVFNGKIEDQEYHQTLLFDVDFQNRSVLKIITTCNFEPLLNEENPLSNNIMNKIYIGDGATMCDGDSSGFSSIKHILEEEPKQLHEDDESSFYDKVSMGFEHNLKVDYAFQHRYRSKSIQIYFYKDLIFGFVLMMICLLIWFDYLNKFRGPDSYVKTIKYPNGTISTKFDPEAYEGDGMYDFFESNPVIQITNSAKRLEQAIENHAKFRQDWYPWQLGVSSLIIFQMILRLGVFEIFKKDGLNSIEFDRFLIFDVASAGMGFFVFFYVCFLTKPEDLVDDKAKNKIDILVALLMVLILSRYFILQLVVPSVSKMMLTLFAMLWDVMPFNFIMIVYILGSVQFFSTWLQDLNPDLYGDPFLCFNTQFDNMLGGYSYGGVSNLEFAYTIVMILHLFIINILLLNFMVAILSTTYGDMLESGSFLYKCSLFQYCEKYMIAFQDDRIGELMIHSPPLNFFSLLMLPTLFVPDQISRNLTERVTQRFSYLNFWIENIFIVIVFMAYELCMLPLAYLLTFYNIMVISNSTQSTLMNWLKWLVLGVVYLLHMILKDMYYLIQIMSMYEGCVAELDTPNAENEDEEELTSEQKICLYNEVRIIVIQLYCETKKKQREELEAEKNKDEESQETDDKEEGEQEAEEEVINYNTLDIEDVMQNDMEDEETWDDSIMLFKINEIQDKWRKSKRQVDKAGQDQTINKKKSKNLEDEFGSPSRNQENDEKEEDEEDERSTNIQYDTRDDNFVNEVLSKFLIDSESSFLDTINISLVLQALPNKIVGYSLDQMMQFNFQILQKSLIAFQTADQVDAFEHFDEINMDRVEGIKQQIADQKKDLEVVVEKMENIKTFVQKSEENLQNFEELSTQYNNFKKVREQERLKNKAAHISVFQEPDQKTGKKKKSSKKQ